MEPEKLRKLVRGELDWIVMRCLEKDRNRRYETASSLAADVERYLHDEPVRACPPSTWYRFRKFARRNRRAVVTASAAALVVVLAVAGLATSTLLTAPAGDEVREDLRHDTYFHRIAAHRELSVDNSGPRPPFLEGCPDLAGVALISAALRVEPVVLRDKTEVNSLAFSPAAVHRLRGRDRAVKVWEPDGGGQAAAHADSVYSVVFPRRQAPGLGGSGPEGEDLGLDDWPPCSPARAKVARIQPRTAYCLAFSPDGSALPWAATAP
jgi:hypothetical protein